MSNRMKSLVELGDNDNLILGSISRCVDKLPETIRANSDEAALFKWSSLREILLTLNVSDAREFIQELFRINDPTDAEVEEERQFFEGERAKLLKIFGDEYLNDI